MHLGIFFLKVIMDRVSYKLYIIQFKKFATYIIQPPKVNRGASLSINAMA